MSIPTNLQRSESWIRLLYVILFWIIYSVAEVVLAAVVILQFGFVLISGEKNQKLLEFGDSLTQYIYQIVRFASFNSDDKPYPFSDWPSSSTKAAQAASPSE